MRGLLGILLAGCVWGSESAAAAELGVLVPVIANGKVVQKADPSGQQVPVVTRLHSGALYEQLQKEAVQGFTGTVLALDELAQHKAGATVASPTWLYLATEDGGFARKGFWLREVHDDRERPEGRDRRERAAGHEPEGEHFVAEPFVDLVVDPDSVANGGFEEIFAHEMGHVFLRRLLPKLPRGYSRTPHASLTVTDNPTAFDEGFAIHLQGLVRRLTHNVALRNQDLGLESKPFVAYWLSNLDRTARIDGVRRNWFVQAQIPLPAGSDPLARRDQSTLFDTAHLKNGNQMMASEGVLATIFYRWLVPGSAERAAVLQRYGALFDALRALNEQPHLEPDAPLVLDLIDARRMLDPKDGARVLAIVIDTTYGATADATLSAGFESLAAHGRSGDMAGFTSELKAARAALARLQETVTHSPATAHAALGPDIWLFKERPRALAVNLNTAEREYLLELPGIDAMTADRALDSRRAKGPFKDVNDFAKRSGVNQATASQLADLQSAMSKAGTFARE
jgi:DNA uptake protein ComE-like DNA-binding protein